MTVAEEATKAEYENQVERAEKAVRELAAVGRAELEADAERAEWEKKSQAAVKAEARRAVLTNIKRAVIEDGSVPVELFPFMRAEGLGDDGACPNGYVTVCVAFPGLDEGDYIAFNVCQTPEPGRWYVKGEWIARESGSRTRAYSTFPRAVAAALAAGPAIDF